MSWAKETWQSLVETLAGIAAADPDRKASDIVLDCILTIIACAVFCLHLNVPAQTAADGNTSRWREWAPLLRQCKWGLAIVVAPEFLLSLAFGEWRFCCISRRICKRFAKGTMRDWSSTQVHFANMGGLILRLRMGGEELEDSTKGQVLERMNREWKGVLEMSSTKERRMRYGPGSAG